MLIVKKIALNMIPLILFLSDIFIVDFIIKVNIYEIRLILSIYFWILTPIYFSMINYKHIRNIRTFFSNYMFIILNLSLLLIAFNESYLKTAGVYGIDDMSKSLKKLLIKVEYIFTTVLWLIFGCLKMVVNHTSRKWTVNGDLPLLATFQTDTMVRNN